MKVRLVTFALLIAVLLGATPYAFAHRLNEYLQATTIDVEKDRVSIDLRMTPGVDVAQRVLAVIDTNGDGKTSSAEQQNYVQRVRDDLSLSIGGRPRNLRLVSSSFPTVSAMTNGLGDIDLQFEADTSLALGNGALVLQNRHEKDIAAYLVNCLVPRDSAIQIVGQNRNQDQSFYQLDYKLQPAGQARDAALQRKQQKWLDRTSALSTFQTYFWHGVHHILTGYDHLLFIGALVLAATTLWDLVKVVTAFTMAHSITLTLAALGLVHLSSHIVEPFISASIVFVALQNIFWPKRSQGHSRLVVAFLFGLFHGLGFAGGLLDLMHQMSRETVSLAILGFSVGVEAGNQMVLLPLFGILTGARHFLQRREAGLRPRFSMALQRFGSAGIAAAGFYYLCVALSGKA